MGPFQTIDLNAPEGAMDYFIRYLKNNIYPCLKEMDNTREFKDGMYGLVNVRSSLEIRRFSSLIRRSCSNYLLCRVLVTVTLLCMQKH